MENEKQQSLLPEKILKDEEPLSEAQISFFMVFVLTSVMGIFYCGVEGLGKGLLGSYDVDSFDFALERCVFIGTAGIFINCCQGQSLRKDGKLRRNWKPLFINGLAGAVAIVLCNYTWVYLPLTIWFVILCTLPFILGIFSYFIYGEKMAVPSIIAAILSFGAIIMLSFAEPVDEVEGEDSNYLLGVVLCFSAVLAIAVANLTTRQMQEIDSMLIMKSYNWISTVLIGSYILIRWAATGQSPFEMIWCLKSALMLVGACVSHLCAQMAMFYVNQKAQPAIVSLMVQFGIVFRVFTDVYFFDIIPNTQQIIAIVLLGVIQVAHLVFKQRTWKKPQATAEKVDDEFSKQ